jgi:hypothetical protein
MGVEAERAPFTPLRVALTRNIGGRCQQEADNILGFLACRKPGIEYRFASIAINYDDPKRNV